MGNVSGSCARRSAAQQSSQDKKIEKPQPEFPQILWSRIQAQGWLVINGKVYDPTPYLAIHPGGTDIIRALLGTDATANYTTLKHSQTANQELEKLQVGVLAKGADKGNYMDIRMASPLYEATSRSMPELPALQFWNVLESGYLPFHDPKKELPAPWDVFVTLVGRIPSLGVQGTMFREHSEQWAKPSLPQNKQDVVSALANLDEAELELLHATVGYAALAYLRCPVNMYDEQEKEPENKSEYPLVCAIPEEAKEVVPKLPKWISLPWVLVSQMLGRRPMLDYAGCVLNNWERLDKNGPMLPGNLRLLRRFTGAIDEEWFFKTHIIIESEGANIVRALNACVGAMTRNDCDTLMGELNVLSGSILRVASACMAIMYEKSPDNASLLCEPFQFYARLRPFIKALYVEFELEEGMKVPGVDYTESGSIFLHGPSGAMSTLLPSLDAALGIRTSSEKLRDAMDAFELFMPKTHRQFLDLLRSAPSSIKSFIENNVDNVPPSTWKDLARGYNTCIEQVLDFRWRHWNFVKFFILRPASGGDGNQSACPAQTQVGASIQGTGGTHFDYLQQHITDTEKARILLEEDTIKGKTPDLKPLDAPVLDDEDLDPLEEEGYGNGFLPESTAPMWCCEQDAPMPGCFALQDIAWAIPMLVMDDNRTSAETKGSYAYAPMDQHPFIQKCEQESAEMAAVARSVDNGEFTAVEMERLWVLMSFVKAGCRIVAIRCEGSESAGGSPMEAASFCPAMARHGLTPEVGAKCPATGHISMSLLPAWISLLTKSLLPHVGQVFIERPLPLHDELFCYNWYVDRSHKEGVPFRVRIETMHKIHTVVNFLGMPDEEWHRKMYICLEAEGGRMLMRARDSFTDAISSTNASTMTMALKRLAKDLATLTQFAKTECESKDSRGEQAVPLRLASFVTQTHDDEEYACWVYSLGASLFFPALHMMLGLRMPGDYNKAWQRHWDINVFPDLPESRKEQLESFRLPMTARAFCLRQWSKLKVEGCAAMEESYNQCLSALFAFSRERSRYVKRCFPINNELHSQVISAGIQSVSEARLQLLQMRRVASAFRSEA